MVSSLPDSAACRIPSTTAHRHHTWIPNTFLPRLNRISWSVLLKTKLRSRRVRTEIWSERLAVNILLKTRSSDVPALWSGLYADWKTRQWLVCSRCESSRDSTICCPRLEIQRISSTQNGKVYWRYVSSREFHEHIYQITETAERRETWFFYVQSTVTVTCERNIFYIDKRTVTSEMTSKPIG